MSDFKGFQEPKANYSKLPHQLINELPRFTSLAELKVVLYVLRHTWGYQDDYKRLTLDDFETGRKDKNGNPVDDDNGIGMTRPSIISGIKTAIEHGFLYSVTDTSDKARTRKYYSLTEEGLKSFTPAVKDFNPSSKDSLPRTKKETKEKETKDIPIKKSDADILATCFNVVPQTPKDWKFWGNIVKDLKAAGISSDMYPDYIQWLKKQSAAQGNWTVTPTSLTNASRPSLYISEKENKSKSPARPAVVSYEHMQDTRSEAEAIRDAQAAMERGES